MGFFACVTVSVCVCLLLITFTRLLSECGFKPSSKLPAVAVSLHSQLKASDGLAPVHPQQPYACPCSGRNQARCNWCGSQGLIIHRLATTLQQNPSPLFSGPVRLRMDIDDLVELLTDLSLTLQKQLEEWFILNFLPIKQVKQSHKGNYSPCFQCRVHFLCSVFATVSECVCCGWMSISSMRCLCHSTTEQICLGLGEHRGRILWVEQKLTRRRRRERDKGDVAAVLRKTLRRITGAD